jgi:hypothetical protein
VPNVYETLMLKRIHTLLRPAAYRYRLGMKILALCRPRPAVDRDQIAPHAAGEMAALRSLKAAGTLLEAYSPGGPGAVLIFDGERPAVEAAVASLPLMHAGLIDAELIELHPFDGF